MEKYRMMIENEEWENAVECYNREGDYEKDSSCMIKSYIYARERIEIYYQFKSPNHRSGLRKITKGYMSHYFPN